MDPSAAAAVEHVLTGADRPVTLAEVARRVRLSTPTTLTALERLGREGRARRDGSRWVSAVTADRAPAAPPAPRLQAPRLEDWDAVRALCLYYAEALEHEAGLQASLPVGDLGGAVELTHTLDWHALARGQTVSIPGQAGIAQLLATASGNRLRLAGPIELRAGRGARDAALLPLFLLPVVATRRGGRVELRPESALRPNETWVKERFRGREAATFDDVLIRLGFYEERERGPMEDPEMVARPDLRLDEAWGAALDVFGDLWREPGDARRLGTAPPLARLNRAGFYNRLLLLSPVTSNYSGGTIKELRRIATRPDSELERTALAAFFAPFLSRVGPAPPPDPGTPQVVPEFQPLNAEQRAVLADTRTSPLTAVQGPPGTGKSLTVLHVLAAQALDGRPTLFASRNHRALEAVVPRLQAIDDDHPLILRLTRDAGETQDGGEDWVRAMLELTARPVSDERRAELRTARERLAQALGLRATVQRQLEAELVLAATLAEAHAEIASSDRIVDPALLSPVDARASLDPALAKRLERAATQLTRTDRSLLAPVRRFLANRSLVGLLGRSGRLPIDRPDRAAIATALARRVRARSTADRVEREALPRAERIDLVERLRSADEGVRETTRAALQALARALGTELDPQTAVSIANLRGEIGRRNVSRSLHRLGTGTLGLVHDLFRKSLEVVPLWACSSLSVRSRLPLVAGAFDLVVIDEASQCDIPSSIPLLFRARRSMVVGDPQQLQHVAHLDREGERRFRTSASGPTCTRATRSGTPPLPSRARRAARRTCCASTGAATPRSPTTSRTCSTPASCASARRSSNRRRWCEAHAACEASSGPRSRAAAVRPRAGPASGSLRSTRSSTNSSGSRRPASTGRWAWSPLSGLTPIASVTQSRPACPPTG